MTTPRAPDRLQQDTRDSDARPEWNLQDTEEGDGITSPPRCSEGKIRTPPWDATRRHTQLMSSLSSLVHAITKEAVS